MREYISRSEARDMIKRYKSHDGCCLIKLNGKKIRTRDAYYDKLRKKLRLNATFSNNYNAYSDMMRDAYTYYDKQCIVFVIKHYEDFLSRDGSKEMIERIFDQDIIPYFQVASEIHVYCVGGKDRDE